MEEHSGEMEEIVKEALLPKPLHSYALEANGYVCVHSGKWDRAIENNSLYSHRARV